MKRICAFLVLAFPFAAFSQEVADKLDKGTVYGLSYGLMIFLTLIGVHTVYEKIRDTLEAKRSSADEAARPFDIGNDPHEVKL